MASSPTKSIRVFIVLFLSAAGWAFGFGLGAPLASLWLRDHEGSTSLIGFNTGVYYFGIALTAGFVPRMMRRWGLGTPIWGMILSGVTIALFPWGKFQTYYFLLRFLNGVGGAMSLIPLETWVNQASPSEHRGRNFGFYAFSVALGWALGNFIGLQIYPAASAWSFALGGAISGISALTLWMWMPPIENKEEKIAADAPLAFFRNFFSFGSAWAQGFLEGGMVSLLPVYLLAFGMTENGVSWLTSGIMIGVILFQVPVAWLTDKLGTIPILVACYMVTLLGLGLLPLCGMSVWLPIWLFFAGACSGSMYPLGLALLGDKLPPSSLARASACYLALNCVGSLTGPALTGVAMEWLGNRAMFVVGFLAVLAVFSSWLGLQIYYFRVRNNLVQKEIPLPEVDSSRAA